MKGCHTWRVGTELPGITIVLKIPHAWNQALEGISDVSPLFDASEIPNPKHQKWMVLNVWNHEKNHEISTTNLPTSTGWDCRISAINSYVLKNWSLFDGHLDPIHVQCFGCRKSGSNIGTVWNINISINKDTIFRYTQYMICESLGVQHFFATSVLNMKLSWINKNWIKFPANTSCHTYFVFLVKKHIVCLKFHWRLMEARPLLLGLRSSWYDSSSLGTWKIPIASLQRPTADGKKTAPPDMYGTL